MNRVPLAVQAAESACPALRFACADHNVRRSAFGTWLAAFGRLVIKFESARQFVPDTIGTRSFFCRAVLVFAPMTLERG